MSAEAIDERSPSAKRIAQQLEGVAHPVRWLVGAVAIKVALYLLVLALANTYLPGERIYWYQSSGDEAGYVKPAEHLLAHGTYLADARDPWSGVYRMPGYSLTYLLFRIPLGQERGKTALIIFQVVLGGVAAYLTARVAGEITARAAVFVVAFWLATLSISASIFDTYTVTDSLATNALVVTIWLLLRDSRTARPWIACLAGGVFAYCVFLRPFFLPLLGGLGAFVWSSWPRTHRHKGLALFIALPAATLSLWTARNFMLVGQPVLLQTAGVTHSPAERAVRRWLQSFGGEIAFWRPGTIMAWLEQTPGFAPNQLPVPASALTEVCNAEDVAEAASLYRAFRKESDPIHRAILEPRIAAMFDKCRSAYVSTNVFDHQVVARVRLLRSLLVHSGVVLPLPRFADLPRMSAVAGLKLLCAGIYVLVLTLGLVGLCVLVRQGTTSSLLIAFIPLYFLVLLPVVLRLSEPRYVVELWPFLCISSAVLLVEIRDRSDLGRESSGRRGA